MYIGESQNNEEIIINEIFKKLNIKKGKFFEIGVNNLNIDGTIECNSLNLMKQGWDGNLIDAFYFVFSPSNISFNRSKFIVFKQSFIKG